MAAHKKLARRYAALHEGRYLILDNVRSRIGYDDVEAIINVASCRIGLLVCAFERECVFKGSAGAKR